MTPERSAELEPRPAPVDDRAARLAALAHEVRAPLASVEGWAELLLDGALGELTDEQVRAVEVVRRNAERIGLLVDELRCRLHDDRRGPTARGGPGRPSTWPSSSRRRSTWCDPRPGSGPSRSSRWHRTDRCSCSVTRPAWRGRW